MRPIRERLWQPHSNLLLIALLLVAAASFGYLNYQFYWFYSVTGYKTTHDGDVETMFWSTERWRDVLSRLGSEGRRFIAFQELVPDMIFPLSFGFGLSFLLQNRVHGRPWWTHIPLLATLFDMGENILGVVLVSGYVESRVELFAALVFWRNWVKLIKYVFYAISIALPLVLLLRRLCL